MVIGVCGFTSTGSSAVVDYLKEYDKFCVVDNMEFTLPYYPDGLEDLDYHLNISCSKYAGSVVAIERFRRHMQNFWIDRTGSVQRKREISQATEEFLKAIVQVEWDGYGTSDLQMGGSIYKNRTLEKKLYKLGKNILVPRLEKISSKDLDGFLKHRMEFSMKPENFDEEAIRFVKRILGAYGADFSKPLVLNQPFAGNDPEKSFKFFEDPVAIIVDRDPRDNYLFAKKFLRKKGRQIPTESVQKFVSYYRNMRRGQPYSVNGERVLNIHFEDMVYRYEDTVHTINEFCGIKDEKRVRTIFVPEMSINNTQVFRRYPEYEEDVRYIEQELPEYLYPFEQFGDVTIKGKMFSGNSPLNK